MWIERQSARHRILALSACNLAGWPALAAVAVLAASACIAPLQAQGITFRAAAGAAFPLGGAEELRDPGPSVTLSIEKRLSSLWSLRLDGEWSELEGVPAPEGQEHFKEYQPLRITGGSLNGVLRISSYPITPYLLAGIGAYRLQRVEAPRSPYGITGAVQAGVGVDGNLWERVNPIIEARAMVHLTDYGSDEFTPTIYAPVLIGLRIR